MDGVGAAQGVGAHLREADVADQALLHELGQCSHGLFHRNGRIQAGRPVDVHVVGAEAPEGVGQEVLDGHRTGVHAVPSAPGIAQDAELHADLGVLAPAAADRLAQQHFVVAHAVEVAGVQQGHAGVEGGLDRGDALGVVGGAVKIGHAHQAEADGGGAGAGGAQGAGGAESGSCHAMTIQQSADRFQSLSAEMGWTGRRHALIAVDRSV